MSTECIREYRYQGLVWSCGEPRPGSSAYEVVYEDRYYCVHYVHTVDRNRRVVGNSYGDRVAGSVPK